MTNYNDAWLGLEPSDLHGLENPFFGNKIDDDSDSQLEVIRLMRNPKYIGWTCKVLFNIELLPMQIVIMQELFSHAFPMFIASRGFGKTQDKMSYIITNKGHFQIQNLLPGDLPFETKLEVNLDILGENGFHKPAYLWRKKPTQYCNIITKYDFNLKGSTIHPVRCVQNGNIVWKKLEDLQEEDYVVIDRNKEGYWPKDIITIDNDVAYLFGCLVGDGSYTSKGNKISFTNQDNDVIIRLNKGARKLWNKEFILGKNQSIQYYLPCSSQQRRELFNKHGFNSAVCAEKDIPFSILTSSKTNTASFLRGLFDTDGCAYKKYLGIEYCSKSENLTRRVQFLLTRFGIISRVKKRLNKKYNRFYYNLYIFGDDVVRFSKEIGFGIKYKQERLDHLAKKKTSNTNNDIIPHVLILDRLISLTQEYKSLYSIGGHGYSYDRQLLAPSRLKKYQISYLSLKKILDLTESISWCDDWQFLNDIYNKHYFYDKVTEIQTGYSSDLYDFFFDEDDHSYLSNGFISHNSFLLALYAIYKMTLFPGTKVIMVGAAFRQAKIIYEYAENIWFGSSVLRSIGSSRSGSRRDVDRCTLTINDSSAICIPLGDGSKIRGLRGNLILADEFGSINPQIYETVVQGFGVVSKTPIDNVQEEARKESMQKDGKWTVEDELVYSGKKGNQAIISGTATYSFNPFHDYWYRYKTIIECKGNLKKLKSKIGDEEIAETMAAQDYRDYCVIRIPYELVPKGFMDVKQILRAKAGLHTGIYQNEYGAVFSRDSQGFFKRSLMESCIANEENIEKPNWPVWCPTPFDAKIRGNRDNQYVYGIDPASEEDNFALIILEIHPEHQRIVHLWTTNRLDFRARQKAGLTDITDYYGYCVRKIRDLMKIFPCVRIGIDSQGGGHQIVEGLHDKDKMYVGELPIWEVIEEKEKETDNQAGSHIIEVINFAKAEWTRNSNHGARKDLEDKILLFPRFDSVTLALSNTYDKENFDKLKEIVGEGKALKLYDTLEDCALEIEMLKDELSTIVMTQTGIEGRDRFDVPEVKLADGKKGRLRKDRYSALVIANMLARQIYRALPAPEYLNVGLVAGEPPQRDTMKQQLYSGPEWANQIGLDSIHVVRR